MTHDCGPLGLSHEDSLTYACRFFSLGFLCLPFLWAVSCFYFWPVLRHHCSHHSHPHLRRYLVESAVTIHSYSINMGSFLLLWRGICLDRFGRNWYCTNVQCC